MSNIFDLFKKIESEKAPAAPVEYIIAGLGNPGARYEHTRHNAGFRTISVLMAEYGVTSERSRFDSLCSEAYVANRRALIMRPQTLMNASGRAVKAAADFYKIPPENIIVICDDINLDVGRMRVRRSGSSGGQKGIGDIIRQLGSEAFPRVKIGVGKKPAPDYDLADWVLSRFTSDEEKILSDVFVCAADAARLIVAGDIERAMNKCN